MQELSGHPAATLSAELDATVELSELLKQEQVQLIAGKIEAITQITEEKSTLVGRMSTLAAQRYAALAALGFPNKEAGMQAWLTSQPEQLEARALWETMLTLARSAKENNRVNGLLIHKQLNRSQDALHVLRGSSSLQGIYGPNGQTSTNLKRQHLVIS